MQRNMVIGKLKYWIEPQPEHTFPPSLNVVSHAATCGCKKAHDPTYCGVDSGSRGGWPWSTTRKERWKVAWAKRDVDPHACVLGLPGQVNKFDSNRPLLTVWDCLIPLPHRVIRVTLFDQSWCLTKVIPWLSRVSCLHRMDNQLEYWKLKCEIKDLVFIAFQQKETRALQNPA